MDIFRKMKSEDLDKILQVEGNCFVIPWSKSMFLEELKNPLANYFVIALEEEIIGYMGVWYILDEGHITNIAIHPDYQQNGYGQKLLGWIIKKSENKGIYNLTLEVRVSNKAAIKLYKKFNFKSTGIRKNYYEDNKEDALVMWRKNE